MSENAGLRLGLERRGQQDIDDIYELILVCGEDMWRRLGLDHWRPPSPKSVIQTYARERYLYAVLEDNRLVATFTIGTESPEPYPETCWADAAHRAMYLNKLAVHPEVQGNGYGRWCMDQVERLTREHGCHAVRFDALLRNTPLLGFYDRLGYRRCGMMQVADEIGRWWDILMYEKVVAPRV